jgi:hypothetical protein
MMITEFIVKATYHGKIDARREQRIDAVLDRCGVGGNWGVQWLSYPTELRIEIAGDERATRLASELRACGLLVSIGPDEDQ